MNILPGAAALPHVCAMHGNQPGRILHSMRTMVQLCLLMDRSASQCSRENSTASKAVSCTLCPATTSLPRESTVQHT